MRTLAGSGQAGFADGQGPAARFNELVGLSLDTDGSLLVADFGNHAIRRVTMAGTSAPWWATRNWGLRMARAQQHASFSPVTLLWTERAPLSWRIATTTACTKSWATR